MSSERCFGGFAGHNVDRRQWAGTGSWPNGGNERDSRRTRPSLYAWRPPEAGVMRAEYREGRTFAVPWRCWKAGILLNPAVHTVSLEEISGSRRFRPMALRPNLPRSP